MPVTLCVAPPAAGKTQWVVDRVCDVLKDAPLAPVWVIVPDRLQARAFRDRLAHSGGALGARVGTFGDVYTEILERVGQSIPAANHSILHRLILSILEEMSRDGSLVHYAPLVGSTGFSRTLGDRFAELKRALVWPEAFVGETRGEGPQVAELAQIYRAYQARLQKIRWADPEGLSWLAVEALEGNPALLAGWRLVGVDGFDDFNRTQRKALQLLSRQAQETLITLPGTLAMDRPVHGRFRRALEALQSELKPGLHALESPPRLPAPLAALESSLLESGQAALPANPHVHLIETQSAYQEAREALRWIKAHVRRSRVPLGDCAVFFPDMEPYREPLRTAAREFGLPIRFTQGVLLAHTPAVSSLLDLLRLPIRDYPRRVTLDCIRSPYFDLARFGLSPADAPVLEAASFQAQVVGGKEQWISALDGLAAVQLEEPRVCEDEAGAQQPQVPQGAEAARLARGLKALADRLETAGEKPARDWVVWLEDLLDELGFGERCEAAIADPLREALRALVAGELAAGRREFTYNDFVADLQDVLESCNYDPEAGWRGPAVLAGRLVEARGVRFQAVAILGLSEGVFPAIERPDPLFDEKLRARFGLDPRLGRRQAGLFYQAVTRPDRFLLLTRPYLAKGGEAWEPSHYWTSVQSIFPDSTTRIRPDAPRRLANAASGEEALFWAARQGLSPKSDPGLISRARQVELGCRALAARLGSGPPGPYDGCTPELAPELGRVYGEGHTWSASRLESYAACPYRFFAEQVLKLEPRQPPELGFDARQLGAMLHAILEKAYRRARDRGDSQAVLAVLPGVAAREFSRAPRQYGFRPDPLWEAQQEQLLSRLEKTIREMEKVNRGWTPAAFELAFGFPGGEGKPHYPPLEMTTSVGKVRLHGFVDRVDCDERGRCRVVDYKTGSSHLGRGDLVEGYRLQLPLYALAAQEACRVGEVVDGLYWSINQARAYLELGKFEYEGGRGLPAALDLARAHVERILGGIRAAAFPPIPPKGGCSGYCAASAWCWRYEPGFGS